MDSSKLFLCVTMMSLFNYVAVSPTSLKGDLDEDNDLEENNYVDDPPPDQRNIKLFKCHSCDAPDCRHNTTCYNAIQCWKSSVRASTGEEISRGCTKVSEQLPFFCKTPSFVAQNKVHASGQYRVDCCEGDFCNNGSFPELPPVIIEPYNSERSTFVWKTYAFAIVATLIFGILSVVIVCFWRRRKRMRLFEETRNDREDYYASDELLKIRSTGDETLQEYLEQSVTSGSGSGLPLLIQRTMAKQITLVECIGKGRFGEVWKGTFRGGTVAVKIFSSRDEASWTRETEIYSTILLRNRNILGYIASDMTSRNSCTQLWLVTHYHPFGSLYDYLNNTTLSHQQMLALCISIASGLVHLHTEIFGNEGKPAIAHRDIKSKNILVQKNGSCCIADFGLAVTHTQATDHLNMGTNTKVGTKRYMAPEVLEDTLRTNHFDSYRKVDIYAFGLVLWEISSRTISNGIAEEYKPPFAGMVNNDPTFEEMKKVVCCEKRRPNIPNRWSSDQVLSSVAQLIRECWHHNPNVRLPALRLKKSLTKYIQYDRPVILEDNLEVCV